MVRKYSTAFLFGIWVLGVSSIMVLLQQEANAKVQLYHEDKKVQAGDGGKWLKVRDIIDHGLNVLGVNSPKKKDVPFMRWEQPIRYYVAGLNAEEKALFQSNVEEMQALTGLDIKEHTQLKLAKDIYQLNDPSKPESTFITNAVFFIWTKPRTIIRRNQQ